MEEHSAHRVVEGTKDTFSFTILLRSIGTIKMKDNALCSEEIVHGMVDKFCPIISLETFDGKTELCTNIGNKISKVLTDLRLVLKGKRPAKMSEIIKEDQVITATRNTRNRRRPDITMNYLKRRSSL